ncbi:MAG: hypothetical protein IKQ15_04850 [Kiritimatiellae bacterium]|nr:hypothetical protein [Kiritimatiellia bacterium]
MGQYGTVMEIVVTGGCGFIGANLAVAFRARGEAMTARDTLSRRGPALSRGRRMDTTKTAVVPGATGQAGPVAVRHFLHRNRRRIGTANDGSPFFGIHTGASRSGKKSPGNKMSPDCSGTYRMGNHSRWNSAASKSSSHYLTWHLTKTVRDILSEIHEYNLSKWKAAV